MLSSRCEIEGWHCWPGMARHTPCGLKYMFTDCMMPQIHEFRTQQTAATMTGCEATRELSTVMIGRPLRAAYCIPLIHVRLPACLDPFGGCGSCGHCFRHLGHGAAACRARRPAAGQHGRWPRLCARAGRRGCCCGRRSAGRHGQPGGLERLTGQRRGGAHTGCRHGGGSAGGQSSPLLLSNTNTSSYRCCITLSPLLLFMADSLLARAAFCGNRL
jgi:hypothetical protein